MAEMGEYSGFLFSNQYTDLYKNINMTAVDKKVAEAQQRQQNNSSSQSQYKNTAGSMFGYGFG